MARLTRREGDIWAADDPAAALDRLAAFENLVDDINAEQETLAAKLEALRTQGKKNSTAFKEALGRRLMNNQILILLEMRGLD